MKQTWIAMVVLCAVVVAATAQDQQAATCKRTLSAGMTMTDGNSETLQANASLVGEGEHPGFGSMRVGIEGNYAENKVERTTGEGADATVTEDTETTVENARAFANFKKTISERTFGYLDGVILYDSIADIDYRATVSPGLGVYLLKNDRTTLSVEAGPAYIWEKVGGESDDYLALRFAERFTHALSATAKVWQSAEFLPAVDDFDDYLLNAEVGVEAALNARMSLRLVLQDKYDNTPAEGLDENDVALIAGISVKL